MNRQKQTKNEETLIIAYGVTLTIIVLLIPLIGALSIAGILPVSKPIGVTMLIVGLSVMMFALLSSDCEDFNN